MTILQKYKTQTVAKFDIQYLQFLDSNAKATQALPEWTNNPDELIHLYEYMVLTRAIDKKAFNLQRTGKLGTYPPCLGQEALVVGMGSALKPDDVFASNYRDLGAYLMRNILPEEIYAIWGGDERGNNFKHNKKDLPFYTLIAGQYLHAAGIAYAFKYRKENRAVLVSGGDGSTSKGEFYETLNLAGVWNLPLVCMINNNQWAISTPKEQQTKAQTYAQKGIAAGIDAYQVNGNDVIAVKEILTLALNKAREGGGPTLIEALTFRLSDHTTADDASRYGDKQKLDAAWKIEPIKCFRNFLISKNIWNDEKEKVLTKNCEQKVKQAVENYLNMTPPKATDMFDYLFEKLPAFLEPQRKMVEEK